MNQHKLLRTSLVLATGAGLIAACSTTPQPNANLNQAKSTYAAASADPMVRTSAPEKLADAEEALNQAEKDWANNADKSKVDHNAYLAQRYAQTAMEAAKFRTADQQTANIVRTVTLPEVLFEVGKPDLNAEGKQAINDLAEFLRVRPDRSITVLGYTDSTGSARLNATLSNARAENVKSALVAQGIDAGRIEARGMGPSNPVASNATAAGRQQNRRVAVAISEGGATTGTGSSMPPPR
jgi:outer membrane protein OmpA-like peptidoglycan-associated protein